MSSNYAFISETITTLEGFNTLNAQVNLVNVTIARINKVEGEIAERIKTKLKYILKKNQGFEKIKQIANVFDLNSNDENNFKNQYSPKELASFKYAPITSVDVERSFSMYKSFLRPNRSCFTFDQLKKQLFIYTNKNI